MARALACVYALFSAESFVCVLRKKKFFSGLGIQKTDMKYSLTLLKSVESTFTGDFGESQAMESVYVTNTCPVQSLRDILAGGELLQVLKWNKFKVTLCMCTNDENEERMFSVYKEYADVSLCTKSVHDMVTFVQEHAKDDIHNERVFLINILSSAKSESIQVIYDSMLETRAVLLSYDDPAEQNTFVLVPRSSFQNDEIMNSNHVIIWFLHNEGVFMSDLGVERFVKDSAMTQSDTVLYGRIKVNGNDFIITKEITVDLHVDSWNDISNVERIDSDVVLGDEWRKSLEALDVFQIFQKRIVMHKENEESIAKFLGTLEMQMIDLKEKDDEEEVEFIEEPLTCEQSVLDGQEPSTRDADQQTDITDTLTPFQLKLWQVLEDICTFKVLSNVLIIDPGIFTTIIVGSDDEVYNLCGILSPEFFLSLSQSPLSLTTTTRKSVQVSVHSNKQVRVGNVVVNLSENRLIDKTLVYKGFVDIRPEPVSRTGYRTSRASLMRYARREQYR